MIIREFGCSEKMLRSLIVFVLAISGTVLSSSKKHAYHGVIREDAPEGAEVELDQPLNARTGEICSYTVFSSVPNLPFKVIQEDLTGEVKIVLGRGFQLDYETRNQYDFEIEAHSCNANAHSQKESVHIEVEDVVDDLDPNWKQRSYYAEVVEGKIYDRLVHLEAAEPDDRYDSIFEVCRYRILTPDMPFQVDADGYLRNTEPLDYNKKHSYVLEVAAIDCSSHKSDKIFVNIEVKALCRPGWIGLQDRVEFSPREGRKLIAPEAGLELCDGHCNLTRIAVTTKLTTTHIGKGCDRDTYSLQSQRKLCGASDGTIDLLPSPSASGGWTKDLPTDDGQESDQIFAFDGRMTAVEIPQSRVDPNVGRQFTISTWMKHEDEEVEEEGRKGKGGRGGHKGIKEHILCHSDGEEMNRQHYALYVHNCRLVLLVRREPGSNVDMNSLRPGEWRWKLPEVCDKKWHHYAISMTFPEVELYVDGKRFIESKHNPEMLDEWPLHPTKHVHFTKLVVGACWLGGKNHMGHFFRGYLAGLSILKNRTESDRVIQCLNTCQEKLDFPGIDDMENGMTVSMNNEMTTITVSGITVDSVEKLLRRITYINSRTFPTPGHRPFSLETQATCSDGKVLPVDGIKTLIMVLEPEKPIIVVKAAKVFERDEHGLVHGEKIFHNLTISAFTKTEENERMDADEKDGETIDSGDTYLLDSCLIRVNPQMNLDVEHFRYPENLLNQLRMEADISEDGLVIAGADKLSNYEEVLRGVRYVNARPEELNSRTFILTCTELNGRFVSNQLDVTIEVNHVQHERTAAPQAIAVHKVLQPQAEISHHDRSAKVDKKNSDTQTVTGIVIMCVVCAGFIVLLVVLGVMRIRNARRHIHDVNVEEKQEMEWDNSALTITVNPMDQEALYDETYDAGLRCGDSDSDDEGSLHEPEAESSDGEPEEEEETEKAKTKELEWDDSTLSF